MKLRTKSTGVATGFYEYPSSCSRILRLHSVHCTCCFFRYEDAVKLLKGLLQRCLHDRKRGYWTLRLSVDLEHLGFANESLSVAEEGILDPWVRAGSRLALQKRVLRLGKPPRRWKIPDFAAAIRRKIPEVSA